MAGASAVGASYSKKIAFVYVFNLIVGVGALALPFAFHRAGIVSGVLVLALNAFMAFICVTFVIEAMSSSNFMLKQERQKEEQTSLLTHDDSMSLNSMENIQNLTKKKKKKKKSELEDTPELISYATNPFSILERTEIGKMTEQFLGIVGKSIFYIIIIVYLFGDLAIYAVSVPTSLLKVTGPMFGLSQMGTYYIYLGIFSCVVVPFSFFNFQKTKYLQYTTLATRNIAFFLMILLSLIFIIEGHGSARNLEIFNLSMERFSKLFSVSIYAFMCHHSLPSIVSPIKDKRRLTLMFLFDFALIFFSYVCLCYVAVFAFGDQPFEKCSNRLSDGPACQIQQLFTLNFTTYRYTIIAAFLALFPVFTLTSNYPLIAITLRNNIQILFERVKIVHNWKYNSLLFSAIAAIPPIILAFVYQNIQLLVSFTGGFAGLFIQYVFPTLLVIFGRRKTSNAESSVSVQPLDTRLSAKVIRVAKSCAMYLVSKPAVVSENPHSSPFYHGFWIVGILIFSLFALIVNSYALIKCDILDMCK
ncbi:hypothetical protein FDP41_009270 [Naegleria fowleri]|uniref:Amino acid transporter transmembrane domain-containing protein n=1 Tax=Naegleria fowleri TaxID=5763 RepID=A0A6A5B261_NAEFO|nr:uncharacterized protein FDP41_009270 [Naegleria fowleri]KAF0972367.1 hypothetical protein FDP41_009270 [Naegleria fowleri]CAG4714976.1 unnamed protein product [Naegleria fowleri]